MSRWSRRAHSTKTKSEYIAHEAQEHIASFVPVIHVHLLRNAPNEILLPRKLQTGYVCNLGLQDCLLVLAHFELHPSAHLQVGEGSRDPDNRILEIFDNG